MVNLSRSVYRYRPDTDRDLPVITAIQAVLEVNPGYGFGKLFKTLRRQGYRWNHKRVYRVYCLLKLNKRRKGKRRLPSRHPEPLVVPPTANVCWSVDFMSDALMCGRRFRTFNVVDDFNREALAIEIDLNLPAPRIIRVLERVALLRGYPDKLRARQRSGVYLTGPRRLGRRKQRDTRLYPTWQADAELIRRTLQSNLPRRAAGSVLVPYAQRGPTDDRRLAGPIQQ